MRRVLITDGVHEVLPEGLRQLGYTIDYQPDIGLEEVRAVIGSYEGLVINSKILIDREMLDAATRLKWVGRLGSGLEIIDRPLAAERGVAIFSSPEGNAPAVGEHALGMLLALSNKIISGDKQVRTELWDREAVRGRELSRCLDGGATASQRWRLHGRRVGIVGFGHTGPAFAKTLAGFAVDITVYDPYRPGIGLDFPHLQLASTAEEVLRESEILSLHLPLTPQTVGWLSAERMDMLPEGAMVLNTSRGVVLDLPALVERLESGRLGGACLDVFPNERPTTYTRVEKEIYHRLFSLEQVVLTPHVAGWTEESKRSLAEVILQKVRGFTSS